VSRALYGHEGYHIALRLLTTIERAEHRRFYDTTDEEHIDLIQDDAIVDDMYPRLLLEIAI